MSCCKEAPRGLSPTCRKLLRMNATISERQEGSASTNEEEQRLPLSKRINRLAPAVSDLCNLSNLSDLSASLFRTGVKSLPTKYL